MVLLVRDKKIWDYVMYGNYNTHQSSGKLTCKHLDITAFALGMLMWHPEKYSDQQLLTLTDIYSDLRSPSAFYRR